MKTKIIKDKNAMKNFKNLLLGGAIVASTAAGLASCSSSDDIAEAPVNPSYDGQTVKTQFAINIATPVTQNKTRMTDVNTQNSNIFLGMNNIYLVPLTIENGIPSDNSNASKVIALADISNSDISTNKSNKIYNDVNIPVGTNNFLFYGTAPIQDINSDYSTNSVYDSYMKVNFAKGSVRQTLVAGSVGDFKFALNKLPIPTDANTNCDMYKARTAFVAYLKNIAATTYTNTNSETKSWYEHTATSGNIASETLAKAYTDITSLKAGSGKSILEAVRRLCDVCNDISTSSTDDDNKILAAAIIANATTSAEGFKATYTAPSSTSSNDSKLIISDSSNDIYTEFPTRNGFPEGCMVLSWTDDTNTAKEPSYIEYNASTNGNGTSNNNLQVSSLAYPLPITYYCNTPLRTSADAGDITWPNTTGNWDTESNWSNWGSVVEATTRKIALQNNINYGVACLKATVKCASESLLDNKGSNVNLGTTINDTQGKGFPIKGIIIGGQPESVGWNYVSNENNHNSTIYDNFEGAGVQNIVATTSGSSANYTLVFDNYSSDGTQPNVKIAIELENNTGVDFNGINGIVAAGQRFYLVGELKLGDTGNIAQNSQIKWPTYGTGGLPTSYENRYPAMAKDTNENNINRIFVQDFTTTANFTINSLKNAYVTIPDLRASKLELGLSVDLSWKTGLTFDVPID